MKAPEKIYLERILCSNEVYDNWKPQKSVSDDIEYTRTDVLIEKAVDYIANNMTCGGYTLQTKAKFIKELRNYMKG